VSPPAGAAARIALLYAAAALAWIVGSDLVLHGWSDHALEDIAKEALFVVVTTVALFVLVLGLLRRRSESEAGHKAVATQLEALVEHHPILVWTMDEDLRYRSLFGRALIELGFSSGDFVGKTHGEVFALFGLDPTESERFHRRALAGESVTYEREYGGRVFDTFLQPLPQDGDGRCIAGISLEVTEHRQSERERAELSHRLVQSQKLDAVGRLAGGIAHDFNNLLTAIAGYAELLDAKLDERDERRGYVAEIQRACERASRLTSRLLTVGRRQVQRRQALDLNELVADLQSLLERVLGEDLELVLELDSSAPRVRADRTQLEQVILNLAINARDAMPTGGTLSIETRTAERGADLETQCAVLVVRDTGVGMDERTREQIFEPFFTTKEPGEGTGLGLATVYGIVAQTEGAIEVDSAPGEGSEFRVYFPLTSAPAAVEPPTPPEAKTFDTRTHSVLVVEDEAAVRSFVREVLELDGFLVAEAEDGESALAAVEAGLRPALLLTDVVLPGMSGIELAARLAESDGDLQVVFMSGYPADAIRRHGLTDGTDVLIKPFSGPELIRRLRNSLATV
jgi:two-component system, cell cycle sensor histidine kinase and response regulator CckA